MTDLTWTCHVCHEERPDEFISVHSIPHTTRWGVQITENIRYCNDRLECIEGAPEKSMFRKA